MRTPGFGESRLQLDERRVADRLHDVAVATAARPVLEALGHGVRECRRGRARGCARAGAYRPPAMAGRITSVSDSDTLVSSPPSTRTSSSLR